jgi:hypothetical protein
MSLTAVDAMAAERKVGGGDPRRKKRQNQWIFLITEKKTIGGVPEKAPFGL